MIGGVASDLTPGLDGAGRRILPDHVLGVSGASTSLAQLTMRSPVQRALDLGTGSGVQALHLAAHAEAVVATDVNPRCLTLAGLTARLNTVEVDLREGSLWEPVAGELFDLVVTNPPFVISPGTGERLVYRDSGLPGDQLVREVVTGVAGHLSPGGGCQLLGNWVHRAGEPWADRVAAWIDVTGCDAWVVERELLDVTRYVELWLDDAGPRGSPEYTSRYDAWLGWFEEQSIEAVGFGWLLKRNAGRESPHVQVESWPYDVEQPLGPHLASWCRAVDTLREVDDAALLGSRLEVAPDVVEERVGPPGVADPERILLRQQRGMRRARQVSTEVAAMVGACDGDLSVGQICEALSTLLDAPVDVLRADLVRAARDLLVDGLLLTEG
ncbi:MAG: methyltransferase [Nocardioidaceae bacterium]